MLLLERLAEELARDTLAKAKQTGNEDLVTQVSKVLGDTSTTMQEAYLTAIRYYRAEARGREVVEMGAVKTPPKPDVSDDVTPTT